MNQPRLKTYSKQEIYEFNEELEKFKNEKGLIDWKKVYVSKGIAKYDEYGEQVVFKKVLERDPLTGYPTRIELPIVEFENLREQWEGWDRRMNFGEKKRSEQFDEIASQLGIKKP